MSVLSADTVLPPPARPPLTRLAKIEARKFVDTRSGMWLLIVAVVLTVIVSAIAAFTDQGTPTATQLLQATPIIGIFLPIIGILGVTSEFSQRTALQTFTWIPQRGRVMVAKALAFAVLGVAGAIVALICAVVFTAAAGGELNITASVVAQLFLLMQLYVFTGLGFGMLFGTPALAIVVWFVAPNVIGLLGEFISGLQPIQKWIDVNTAWMPLANMQVRSDDWPEIIVSSLIWIGIPIVIGWMLLRKREVS